jgi:6-phosphogluconolactonase
VWFVITGSGKREALTRWKNGETLPVSAVRGKLDTVAWLDAAAWPAGE